MSNGLLKRERNKVIFSERINWAVATEFRKAIYVAVEKERSRRLTLDFRQVLKAYPNGVVPIVIEVQRYVAQGVRITILPSEDPYTLSFFRDFGWLHYLDSKRWHDRTIIDQNPYALRQFKSSEELNDTINSAAQTCFQDLHFAKGAHDAFIWSLNEIADNVLIHSQHEYGWLQVVTYRENQTLSLIVCDSGVGIRRTIAQAYEVHDDEQAIDLAITKGVTRDPRVGQGNGLAGTYAIAQHSLGYLAITSNQGRLTMMDGHLRLAKHFPPLEGTFVDMTLPTNKAVDLPRAIGGKPMSFTDMKYVEGGGEIIVNLREYASNFGNRHTGKMLRTIDMLLNSFKRARSSKVLQKLR